jgi:putative flippase GtrA
LDLMKQKLIEFKNKYFDRAMLRWAVVGISTTAIDYTIFILLYGASNSVFGSNLVATAAATTFNYLTHHRWTFKSDQQHATSGVKYLLNLIFWWIVSSSIIQMILALGVDVKVAKLAPLVFIAPVNYFVLNRVVFKKKV